MTPNGDSVGVHTNRPGKFIVFEGIDGSGKSTQVATLADAFRREGRAVHTTREPTDGPIGQLIRQGMRGRLQFDDRVIAALFAADRVDHLTNAVDGMLSLISSGTTVISDRYYLSSYAYHSDFTGIEWVVSANEIATNLMRPDMTIFLDIDPKIALSRLEVNRTVREKYEHIERLQHVRDAYYKAIRDAKLDNVHIVDGSRPMEEIAHEIWMRIKSDATR